MIETYKTHTHTHNRFMALFLGLPGWAGARRNLLLDFMVQGEIVTGKCNAYSLLTLGCLDEGQQ